MKSLAQNNSQDLAFTSSHLVNNISSRNDLFPVDGNNLEDPDNIKRMKISRYVDRLKNSNYCNSSKVISRIGATSDLNNKSQMKWQLNSFQRELYAHKEMEKFMIAFAKNPHQAIEQGIQRHEISVDPSEIAQFLVGLQGLSKQALGEYFGGVTAQSKEVLRSYCQLLGFEALKFDKALRLLLNKFKLPGEAQQIERILLIFSEVYYQVHRKEFLNAGEIHTLSFSLIMLNTDAHSSHQQEKMTKTQFVKNTSPVCPSIPRTYLQGMYDRVTQQKFETETNFVQKIYSRLAMLKANLTGERVTEILKESLELVKGHIFIKYCVDVKKSVQRRISLSDDEKLLTWVDPNKEGDTPRSLRLEDMKDLYLGCNSPVMRKNKVPKEFDSMCFTIVFLSRTLDLKAKDPQHRAKWVNYLRAMLIKKRNQDRQKRQQLIKSEFNKQNVEQIWNNDIFPHWDQHWDYRMKRPKEQRPLKTFFKRFLCCSWRSSPKNQVNGTQTVPYFVSRSQRPLLVSLWKYGLPQSSRKTLWPLVIGNNLKINQQLYQIYQQKRGSILSIQQMPYSHAAIQMVQLFQTVRPDIGLIRNLLELAEVFLLYMDQFNAFVCFINTIHSYHFLTFFQGQLQEIELRLKFFDWLMDMNCQVVSAHFRAMQVHTKLYLVNWFLSVFSTSFQGEFLARIWDNFLLQGELYLFKVGITMIKYFQFQLKMCTFQEAIRLLSHPKDVLEVIFFQILEEQVKVEKVWYQDYIQKRKDAIVKTKVQEIPLQ